jgi:hypothetical protein
MVAPRRIFLAAILICAGVAAYAQERFITDASTTST